MDKECKTLGTALIYIGIALLLCSVAMCVVGGVVWVICWCFNITFSWKIVLGVCVLVLAIYAMIKKIREDS